MSDDRSPTDLSASWASMIPWGMSVTSVIVLFALAWFLIENVFWFRTSAQPTIANVNSDYSMHIFHLHLSMIKRSVALFAGFALIFIGMGVSFYSLEKIGLEGAAGAASVKLATTSPGIVAMVLGAALIMFTTASKDEFAPPPGALQPVIDLNEKTIPPPGN